MNLAMTVDNAVPIEGDSVKFTLRLRNDGPHTASSIVVADALPIGVSFAYGLASQGGYAGSTWSVGTIAAGDSATLTIAATVDGGTQGTTIQNNASITEFERR